MQFKVILAHFLVFLGVVIIDCECGVLVYSSNYHISSTGHHLLVTLLTVRVWLLLSYRFASACCIAFVVRLLGLMVLDCVSIFD